MSHKIVFICTGNTCRSPMAAALGASIFGGAGLDIEVFSAGVSAWDGQPASQNAILAIAGMEYPGISLNSHKSQIISRELLKNASLVLTMTGRHLDVVKSACPSARAFTLYEYASGVKESGDISDPFGGDLEIYRACAEEIKQLLLSCVAKLKDDLHGK